jgi:tRNA-dihydrouridine synthase B
MNGIQKTDQAEKGFLIGNVKIPGRTVLAPMAGVTDLPFRLLCHEMGAALVCTEMVSAKAIYYKNRNTDELMEISPDEGLVSLQLFGSDPELMGEMAKRIEERPFAILDINMGCPVPKIVNNGEGSALMKDPLLIGKIIEAVAGAVKKPVTVKIRKGFDDRHINAAEVAHIAQESGAAAVTVHGRTREQYYSGKADWDIIRKVRETVSIPVIGNGDVTSAVRAREMLDATGCTAVMIGRAAQGNPWIFRETAAYLEDGTLISRPAYSEMRDVILRHAEMQIRCKGEYNAVREMRKHIAWYTKGMPDSASLRAAVNEMEHMDELQAAVDRIFNGCATAG